MPFPVRSRLFGSRRGGCDTPDLQGPQTCHYETLGLSETACTAEIHSAYKRRALATHPDKGGTAADFQRVLDAFQTLSDKTRRKLYDEERGQSKLSRRNSSVVCPRRARSSGLQMFYQKLAELLRKMSAACRRQIILQMLSEPQRAALEKHIRDEKARTTRDSVEPCQSEQAENKRGNGIYKATRVGGYYAKVFVYGLGLQCHQRKELSDVVNDHAALLKVAESLRRGYFEAPISERETPEKLEAAFPPDLIASTQLFFHCRHWIGHRCLQLSFKSLTESLGCWDAMHKAKGPPVFRGNAITEYYSPAAAATQWHRMKETYLHFASGRSQSRAQLEDRLALWEKENEPFRLQRECLLWKRQKNQAAKANESKSESDADDMTLTKVVERLLRRFTSMSSGDAPHLRVRKRKRASLGDSPCDIFKRQCPIRVV